MKKMTSRIVSMRYKKGKNREAGKDMIGNENYMKEGKEKIKINEECLCIKIQTKIQILSQQQKTTQSSFNTSTP